MGEELGGAAGEEDGDPVVGGGMVEEIAGAEGESDVEIVIGCFVGALVGVCDVGWDVTSNVGVGNEVGGSTLTSGTGDGEVIGETEGELPPTSKDDR